MAKSHQLRKIFIVVFLIGWLFIAYFGWKQTTDTSSKLTTITIGYQAGDEFDIAKTRGEFAKKMKKAGYKVKFKEFQNGSAEMQALATGAIDYARTGDTPPVTALASGTNLTYVGAGGSKEQGTGILVKTSSGINSLSDLAGKKIAYTQGTSSQYLLLKALQKAGLSTSDVELVSLDQSAAAVAYEKGKVDAWANWDPQTSRLELNGSKLLVNGSDISDNNRSYLVASTSFAKSNKKVSKLIIKYLNQDMQCVNKNQTKAIKMMAKSLKLSTSVVSKMVKRRTYSFGYMTKTAVQESQDIANLFYEQGVIKKKVNVKSHVQYLK